MKRQNFTSTPDIGKRYDIFVGDQKRFTAFIKEFDIDFNSYLYVVMSHCIAHYGTNTSKYVGDRKFSTNFTMKFQEADTLEFKSSHREGVEL